MVLEFKDVSSRLRGKDFVDYIYVANRIAYLEDGKWRVSWDKLRTLQKNSLTSFGYIITRFNTELDPNEFIKQLLDIWESKKIEVRNKYENDILVLWRRDLFDKYLFYIKSNFVYRKRVEIKEDKERRREVRLVHL